MKKETVLLVVVTLVVGMVVGTIVASKPSRKEKAVNHIAQAPAVNYQQEIQILQEVLEKEPENHNAWIQLGNKYFDANQPMEAIESYDKALAIDGNDPDVLTDQGIMFRRVGWFNEAIENFSKANKIDPRHPQSLLNMGIVYSFDLQEKAKAKEAWMRYLEIDAVGAAADRGRTMIDHMENGHN